jgi:hypothetical protein
VDNLSTQAFGKADTGFDPSGLFHSSSVQFGSSYKKEQTARSTIELFAMEINPGEARELTTQGIKRRLQALV